MRNELTLNLNENERIDDLEINGYKLIQKIDGFCFGTDAVLLSGFARPCKNSSCLELCAGSGVISLLLDAKKKGKSFTLVEIQQEYAELAQRNIMLNNAGDRMKVICDDLKNWREHFDHEAFDSVIVNPPYMTKTMGDKNVKEDVLISRCEIKCDLSDIIDCASKALKHKGRFFMVHRAERITDILSLMRDKKLEPKRIRLVHSFAGKEPVLILVEGIRGAMPGCKIEKPLIIYKAPGVYSDEVLNIYGKNNGKQ